MARILKFCMNSYLRHNCNATYFRQISNSSISKELLRQNKEVTGTVNQDILLNSLKYASTTKNLMEIVSSHNAIMNKAHLMQALRSLFNLHKSGNTNLSTQQILKSADFEMLCKTLRKHAGAIEVNDVIEALKVMSYLGVKSDSTITQVLLQMIRHQVNKLSLHQIIFLDFLLTHLKPTPLIEALQIALPLVFEIQLPIKLDSQNLVQICDCFHFVVKKPVSEHSIEYIISTLLKYNGHIDVKSAISIIWSVCELEPDLFLEPLVNKYLKCVLVEADGVTYQDLDTILTKLVNRFSNKYQFYYNNVLFDLCSNHIIDNNYDLDDALYLLRKCTKMQHKCDYLLDYISDKIQEDPSQLQRMETSLLYTLVNGLAMTDFRPRNYDTIRTYLLQTDKFRHCENKREIYWLKLAANFCILDIFKIDVFEMAFRPTYIHKVIRQGYMNDFENMILIRQAISLYRPDLKPILPDATLLTQMEQRMRPVIEFPLEGALAKAMGGENYVKTGVTSELNHHIDHVVVLREGGYPVALNAMTDPLRLQDFEYNGDKQVVAILALQGFHYTLNDQRLRASTVYSIKTLESLGCTVVPINLNSWASLMDHEKIPYLMQAIKLKTNVKDIVSNYI